MNERVMKCRCMLSDIAFLYHRSEYLQAVDLQPSLVIDVHILLLCHCKVLLVVQELHIPHGFSDLKLDTALIRMGNYLSGGVLHIGIP